jgi:prevent-host-death family protein
MKENRMSWGDARSSEPPSVLRDAPGGFGGEASVTVRDGKAHLSALLEWVAGGHTVTITSDGRPKARLVPMADATPRTVFRGMGAALLKQPVHRGSNAETILRAERDARP